MCAKYSAISKKDEFIELLAFRWCSLMNNSLSINIPKLSVVIKAVARTLIGGGGGCIFIYSGYARLTSCEINFISKETS